MTPLEQALRYARAGLPIFPCQWKGERRKHPLVQHGCLDATADERPVRYWWGHWPNALIALRTGQVSGRVVLDVDVKNGKDGFATLRALGYAIPDDTCKVRTESGGIHIHFDPGLGWFRNSVGDRGGIGPGLDVRGENGSAILPSSGSHYEFIPIDTGAWTDPNQGVDTAPLAPAPAWLHAPKPDREVTLSPVRPSRGLTCYGEAALAGACGNILRAAAGEQETTLHQECFSIGTLAGAAGIPEGFALKALLHAASRMPDYDPRRPWRAADVDRKVRRSFAEGMRHPREALRG
jgi:hypothetical protein